MADLLQRWTEAIRAERYDEAWDLSQQAQRARDPATRDDPALPYHQRWVWDGQPLESKHVLVRCYHGLGDTIQFARYLPLLAERAASVSLEVQPSLLPLIGNMPGLARLVPFDPASPAPRSECDIEITELPFALRSTPTAGPPPYLHAHRSALPQGTIGLCHSAGEWDPARCVPPDLFAPLCQDHPCLTLVAEPSTLRVINPAGCPFDMEATASLVASCALVISVDTMIAHLAGAFGRPTWLLLKARPDWRWNPHAQYTPWYPTMRLFHQRTPGDWRPVLREVERALQSCDINCAGASINEQQIQPPLGQPACSGLMG